MPDPIETELKFLVLPGKAAAFRRRRLEQAGGGPGRREHLVTVYHDTPDRALRRHGLTLRVRQTGERRVQTVKATGGSGLFARPEWEAEIAGDGPDLDHAAGTPVEALLAEGEAGPLEPVFATEVDRTTWLVETPEATIEVALDEGRVVAGDRSAPIAELELELRRGSPTALFSLADRLGGPEYLRLGVETKSERGYALSCPPPAAFKAEPVALSRSQTVAEAVAAILGSCLRHLCRNEPIVIAERSAEALHQARVAVRRLRSALSLFQDVVADAELPRHRRRLKTLSDRLGTARNLDVLIAGLAAHGDGAPEGDRRLLELRVEREAVYARVVAALSSKRHRGLVLDLLAWSETGVWRGTADPERRAALDGPIGPAAKAILRKARRRVRRRGRDLAALTPASRHKVRIAAKKLRYASEFFADLVEGRKARKRHGRILAVLERLQEALGALNDIETARLHSGVDGPAPEAGAAPREEALLAEAVKAGRKLRKAKAFWTRFA